MAEVAFLTGASDPLALARRLIRKKHREGARIAVLGSTAQIQKLDAMLWTEDDRSFVPHWRLRAQVPGGTALRLTRIWLLEQPADGLDCDTAVNLGVDAVPWLLTHAKLAEIVGIDDAGRLAARRRWKEYEALGQKPEHRAVG